MSQTALWTVYQINLQSTQDYDNPLWDVSLSVTFTGPDGATHTIEGFWDGGRDWRVRFSPDQVGEWQWRSTCSNTDDCGLHNQSGTFTCVPYAGDNSLYKHGPLRVSDDRHYLIHQDGTPFFWLADTAWNGGLKAKTDDWYRYLALRK